MVRNYKARGKGTETQRHKVILIIFLCAFAPLCLCASVSYGLDEVPWGRNPFLTRKEISSLQEKESLSLPPDSRKILLPRWEVKAILISGSSRVVTINDRIMTVGDFLNEERILEINEDSVVLGKNGKRRVLKQRQPSIPIGGKEER